MLLQELLFKTVPDMSPWPDTTGNLPACQDYCLINPVFQKGLAITSYNDRKNVLCMHMPGMLKYHSIFSFMKEAVWPRNPMNPAVAGLVI